ncbi:MAG: histidine phosphatase family protein, partial [Deltaproteobacteria bacterium]|nr:histidine phosphatase family protein [Deltaproteobacteria bacterium]
PTVEPQLRERRFGVFEGLTREQCATQHPAAWQAWQAQTTAPPGGEPREEVTARLTGVLTRIADASAGTVLVVSHGGVMRLWMMELLGRTLPRIANGTHFELEHDGARFRAVDQPA